MSNSAKDRKAVADAFGVPVWAVRKASTAGGWGVGEYFVSVDTGAPTIKCGKCGMWKPPNLEALNTSVGNVCADCIEAQAGARDSELGRLLRTLPVGTQIDHFRGEWVVVVPDIPPAQNTAVRVAKLLNGTAGDE